jgi:lipid-A-disaccharide synthase
VSSPAVPGEEPSARTVFIVAGEASGDLHAANFARELLKLDPGLQLRGMGGDSMRAAGVDIQIDAANLAVIGLIEVLAKYKLIKAALEQLKQTIERERPDLLVLVDYQEFNQKLAAFAKSIGIKVLFYIGPQVWAWRPKRVYKMKRIVDQMAVILPFEVELYREAGVPVEFTGNPLVDEVVPDKTPQQAREVLALPQATTIGLFPGSRSGEIKRLLALLIEIATRLKNADPQRQFVLPQAGMIGDHDIEPFRARLEELGVNIIKGKVYDVMQACDVIITASGTATLEIALMGIPMAIVYRVSPLTYVIGKLLVRVEHIGLVNIVAGSEIVREFLQQEAKPKAVAREIERILTDSDYNSRMRAALAQTREKLGGKGGSANIARLALKMLDNS